MCDSTELVKDLRFCANSSEACSSCNRKNQRRCQDQLHNEAADAIEELQQTVEHYKGCADDWYKEACDYKAALPRWIPVTERLPEDFKAVLVYTPKFLNQFMAYHKDDGWRVWSPQDNHGVPFINGQGEITHWMPLPEPPKEE